MGIDSLGDLDCETFDKYKTAIKDPICRQRAKHAVYENQRTIEAVAALKKNDIVRFGELMKSVSYFAAATIMRCPARK